MFNTYGLWSINDNTFNVRPNSDYTYPRESRDQIIQVLKIHNLCLGILGYLPVISALSGVVRMFTGSALVGFTLCVGDRNAQRGIIIQHWYDEAILTGVAQVVRGAFEAIVPLGRLANLCLDFIGSLRGMQIRADMIREIRTDQSTESTSSFFQFNGVG